MALLLKLSPEFSLQDYNFNIRYDEKENRKAIVCISYIHNTYILAILLCIYTNKHTYKFASGLTVYAFEGSKRKIIYHRYAHLY